MSGKVTADSIPFGERTVVGLTEQIIFRHGRKETSIMARIDSGAIRGSIDIGLASKLRLGPLVKARRIRSAIGSRVRPIVEVMVVIHGREIVDTFNLADRSKMKYKVLIGQNILKRGFLIDPNKD